MSPRSLPLKNTGKLPTLMLASGFDGGFFFIKMARCPLFDMDYLRMICGSCGGSIEFPRDSKGLESPCPHCGQNILLWAEDVQPGSSFKQHQIQKKNEIIGVGCLVQGIGLLVIIFGFFWIFPIFIGIILLVIGSRMAVKYVCPQCKNPLAGKDVRICPVCKCDLHG